MEQVTEIINAEQSCEAQGSTPTPLPMGLLKDLPKCLIVITHNGEVVHVSKPQKNRLAIGRASRSDIIINDPHVSRHEGDIILSPSPLFRFPEKNTNSSRVVNILPGKPIRLSHPYRLHLLTEGHVLRNRKKRKGNYSPSGIMAVVSVLSICLVIMAARYIPAKDATFSKEVLVNFTSEVITPPIEIVNTDIKNDKAPTGKNIEQSRDSTKTYFEISSVPEKRAEDTQTSDSSNNYILPSSIRPKNSKPGSLIPDPVLKEALMATMVLLENGETEDIGKSLELLIPLLSREQKSQVITLLDKIFEPKFREAYLLHTFDRKNSEKLLNEILQSNLEFLPSFRKAVILRGALRR